MLNQMNYQWRVTKYNPKFRDEFGHFTLIDDWIGPSQIGETINGKEFTLDEYLRVEAAYINSVIKFMEESNIDSLRVLQLESNRLEEEKISPLYEKEFENLILKEDVVLNQDEIRLICKMVLRNFLWCNLYSKEFFVHFGWDYYMYIGSHVNCLTAIKFATNNGLFVEQCTSPYFIAEDETVREIQWNEINGESKLIVGEEELKNVPLNEYRKIFGLSDHHPIIGSFKIKKEQVEFFQPLLKHKMDFEKYEYYFWGSN